MKTPILGSAYVARSVNAADNRMVNLFPEVIPEGGKESAFLNRAPGLRLLATIGDGPIRGLWAFGGYGYVVSNNKLYRIDALYNVTLLGTVDGTGPVSMASNVNTAEVGSNAQLMIACNPNAYIYDTTTSTFSQITTDQFRGAKLVDFISPGYFVAMQSNGLTFQISALNDGLTWDILDFSTVDGSPDALVSMIVDHNEIWLFGTQSVEVWYYNGDPDFPFARIQGAFNEIGCAAAYSVAKLDNGLFWLGADARGQGIVYRSNGYTGTRISTHAIEFAIAQYGNISDALAYTYQQEGHSFYVLTFPSANATWVYDVATQAWHERASWENSHFNRHRSNCQMAFNSEVIVGDFVNGNIYAFDLDVYDDNGQLQRWLRSWRALPTGQNDLKRTAHHSLQLDCESGVGVNGVDPFDPIFYYLGTEDETTEDWLLASPTLDLYTETGELIYTSDGDLSDTIITESGDSIVVSEESTQGVIPQVMLRWSDDGGHTWSNEHWAQLGKIGQYYRRVFWRRLGMTLKLRDRVYEISGADPVKIVIMGAELHASGTNA
ncbi:hypothetical protein UFOVP830_15 [uncultured Caudovirales phage]|uniref:Bacteriophage P22, Gp10, DNA-stabilising n=1 Tax=uncultured Caudovirales phage TaxID=2100421 RepID=A0A6J5NYV0_9CAUD|nr:hypothetical protein UFOVP830_15 [uncultured Caudovirales phage]